MYKSCEDIIFIIFSFQEADLQSELSKRGLETTGNRDELIRRLQEHLSAIGSSIIDSTTTTEGLLIHFVQLGNEVLTW